MEVDYMVDISVIACSGIIVAEMYLGEQRGERAQNSRYKRILLLPGSARKNSLRVLKVELLEQYI